MRPMRQTKHAVKVTLTPHEQEGVVIRYTLDGTEPRPSSPLYT
jgi:hypothetical protein